MEAYLTTRRAPRDGGFSPAGFGPALWFSLHTGAAAAPAVFTPAVKASWCRLLRDLWVMIPCEMCREHYRDTLRDVDLQKHVVGGDSLFEMTVNLHNVVNLRLGKPHFSLAKARALYRDRTRGPATVIQHVVRSRFD